MLRFRHTYIMTRHVVSISLSGDFLEIRTTVDTEEDAPIFRFELRASDRDGDMDAISAIVASNAALASMTELTPYLA